MHFNTLFNTKMDGLDEMGLDWIEFYSWAASTEFYI